MAIVFKIIFIAFMFMSIEYTLVNVGRLIVRENIPPLNIIIQAIGLTGIITYFLNIWG